VIKKSLSEWRDTLGGQEGLKKSRWFLKHSLSGLKRRRKMMIAAFEKNARG
jgi:hypothetical protein